jgi:integrase
MKRKRRRYPGVRPIKKGEIYEISFYPFANSQRRQFRIKAESELEACRIRAVEMSKASNEPNVKALPFDELRERLILKCRADGNSKKTITNLVSKFDSFFVDFLPKYYPHITSVNQISGEVIESYKVYITQTLNRQYGWRDELTKIKIIFSKLIKIACCNKRIYYEVLSEFKRPKAREKLYKEITKTQIRDFLNYIKEKRHDYYGITYLIARLGWRREQVLSIRRKNIKLQGLRPVAIMCEPADTKTKVPHVLRDIDDELAKVLRQYLFDRRKTEWLFPNRDNKKHHSNHYSVWIAKHSERVLGVRITPHDFRHSFCTMRLIEGHSQKDIMAITGHRDIESFNIYTHSTSIGTKEVLKDSVIN